MDSQLRNKVGFPSNATHAANVTLLQVR